MSRGPRRAPSRRRSEASLSCHRTPASRTTAAPTTATPPFSSTSRIVSLMIAGDRARPRRRRRPPRRHRRSAERAPRRPSPRRGAREVGRRDRGVEIGEGDQPVEAHLVAADVRAKGKREALAPTKRYAKAAERLRCVSCDVCWIGSTGQGLVATMVQSAESTSAVPDAEQQHRQEPRAGERGRYPHVNGRRGARDSAELAAGRIHRADGSAPGRPECATGTNLRMRVRLGVVICLGVVGVVVLWAIEPRFHQVVPVDDRRLAGDRRRRPRISATSCDSEFRRASDTAPGSSPGARCSGTRSVLPTASSGRSSGARRGWRPSWSSGSPCSRLLLDSTVGTIANSRPRSRAGSSSPASPSPSSPSPSLGDRRGDATVPQEPLMVGCMALGAAAPGRRSRSTTLLGPATVTAADRGDRPSWRVRRSGRSASSRRRRRSACSCSRSVPAGRRSSGRSVRRWAQSRPRQTHVARSACRAPRASCCRSSRWSTRTVQLALADERVYERGRRRRRASPQRLSDQLGQADDILHSPLPHRDRRRARSCFWPSVISRREAASIGSRSGFVAVGARLRPLRGRGGRRREPLLPAADRHSPRSCVARSAVSLGSGAWSWRPVSC